MNIYSLSYILPVELIQIYIFRTLHLKVVFYDIIYTILYTKTNLD